jgi:hypothetical protein
MRKRLAAYRSKLCLVLYRVFARDWTACLPRTISRGVVTPALLFILSEDLDVRMYTETR